ncbi:MAG: DTW domain-containing protein [Deltaproteobacteria bacterium]|nr:DTW domain-containing protein [Deltaproteobacteria bacterium]
MSRRDNAEARCPHCRMLGALCVCPLVPVPPLATRTRLVLIIHRYEARKPTNTGLLAARCLGNSEVIQRGHAGAPSEELAIPAGTRPLLLFPHEAAIPLDAIPAGAPVTLIVPDGNWRQAAKVRHRVPGLDQVPCVTLPPGPPTRYRLRSEPVDGGLATFEAIVRALAILEGEDGAAITAAMDHVFTVMVERTLWSRGQLPASAVTGGLPEGVDPRDPSSVRGADAD